MGAWWSCSIVDLGAWDLRIFRQVPSVGGTYRLVFLLLFTRAGSPIDTDAFCEAHALGARIPAHHPVNEVARDLPRERSRDEVLFWSHREGVIWPRIITLGYGVTC